jgi:hypothetical protein
MRQEGMRQERMERTDWLDQDFDSSEARFLMLTAITHHRFNSPIWDEHEIFKLHVELTEIDVLTTQAAVDHVADQPERPPVRRARSPFLQAFRQILGRMRARAGARREARSPRSGGWPRPLSRRALRPGLAARRFPIR